MRVRALYGDVEQLSAQDVGCADTAGDDCCACAVGAGVGALRAAESEFHDPVTAGRVADTCRLGGDQALVVDDVEDRCLHQLRLHDRGDDLDHGLPGEHQSAFGDRVDAARELKAGEILKEVFFEDPEPAEVFNVLRAEVQLVDVLDQLLDPAHDRITAAKGIVPEERVEDHHVVLFFILEVSLHHCQFIEIGEQCQILSVHFFLPDKAFFKILRYTELPALMILRNVYVLQFI